MPHTVYVQCIVYVPPSHAAQFMYRRDQQDTSLSSYFDEKGNTSFVVDTPYVPTPVSPLATTATVASPQIKKEKASGAGGVSSEGEKYM